MKKIVLRIVLLLTLAFMLSAAIGAPAQAQEGETLDEILARAAAKGFLVTLTRPELATTQAFYLQEGTQISDLGEVSSFNITRSEWLTPDETYQVEAVLQPGNRTLVVNTQKENSRWKVSDILMSTTAVQAPAVNSGAAATSGPQIQAVAGNGSGKLVFQTRSGGDIYVINADGTGLSRVTHGLDPQLSPDGTKITFTRWDPQYELFTINVDGTNEQALLSNFRQMKSPTWTADGSKIIFSFQDGGRLESETRRFGLTTLAERAMQGNPVNIPDNARGIEYKDGKLEFTIPPDAYWWLGMVDLTQQEYVDLSTGSQYNYAPTGHPNDPNKIILRADKGMMLHDLQAGVSQPVSFDDRDRGALVISPDGTKVAFTYLQDGHWEIHTMNIDGSNRQRLTETPLAVVAEQHTAGNEVFINEEGFRTMSRAQPGSMPNHNWNNAAPVWSPDGSQIAFMSDRSGKWEIWIMNADGSNQRPMFPNGAVDQLEFNFDGVDERMLSWR